MDAFESLDLKLLKPSPGPAKFYGRNVLQYLPKIGCAGLFDHF